jgi:hypothetical protein
VTFTSSAPIKRALVATLRTNATLRASLIGGIHKGFAPGKAEYPLLTYNFWPSSYSYLWGSAMIYAVVDATVWAKSGVDAENIDALVLQTLRETQLTVDGQTTLICRRVADLDDEDTDDEGRKIYMIGGTYEVVTDQPD